jgi:hypothetical protein
MGIATSTTHVGPCPHGNHREPDPATIDHCKRWVSPRPLSIVWVDNSHTGRHQDDSVQRSSYRAAGNGLLSVLQFIRLSQRRWGWTHSYIIICDNQALVKIMQEQVRQEDAYPNLTISAEWDILSKIRTALNHNMMQTSIQSRHIKGHADNDQPYNKLTLMQQLNVNANRLANEYIQHHQNGEYNIVPILLTSGIQLHMEQQ